MTSSDLHSKTIRPGSLNGFSYYYSNRQPTSRATQPQKPAKSHRKLLTLVICVIIAVPIGAYALRNEGSSPTTPTSTGSTSKSKDKSAPAVAVPASKCAGNTQDKLIKVDVSDRHLWACEAGKVVYDTPVITGMEAHASTLTPPGTYEIYGKQTDLTLTGTDETGSWNDPVSYWMPFLHNKYGIYGFHDATWRNDSEFGEVDPNSEDASHGCVELPLAASAWIYNWAVIGTTVTIES